MGRRKIRTGGCCNGCASPAGALGLCSRCYKRLYYKNNRDKENEARKLFNKKNRHNISKRKREREKEDLNFKIANRLRSRLYKALRGKYTSSKSIEYLGCSVEELRKHIESQFQPGMTWDNHSPDGWHIDHIVPLASLDLSVEDNLRLVCHYTNLRPVWRDVNLSRRYVKE